MPPTDNIARLLTEIGAIKEDIRELKEDRHHADRKAIETSERAADGVERLDKAVEKLTNLLTGNGDPSKGFIVRFDRAEQQLGRYTGLTKTLIGAIITGIVSMIFFVLKHP
jgi:hypothetical protein